MPSLSVSVALGVLCVEEAVPMRTRTAVRGTVRAASGAGIFKTKAAEGREMHKGLPEEAWKSARRRCNRAGDDDSGMGSAKMRPAVNSPRRAIRHRPACWNIALFAAEYAGPNARHPSGPPPATRRGRLPPSAAQAPSCPGRPTAAPRRPMDAARFVLAPRQGTLL